MREWTGRYHIRDLGALEIKAAGDRFLAISESWTLRVGSAPEGNGDLHMVAVDRHARTAFHSANERHRPEHRGRRRPDEV
jgi:hypothetical protein